MTPTSRARLCIIKLCRVWLSAWAAALRFCTAGGAALIGSHCAGKLQVDARSPVGRSLGFVANDCVRRRLGATVDNLAVASTGVSTAVAMLGLVAPPLGGADSSVALLVSRGGVIDGLGVARMRLLGGHDCVRRAGVRAPGYTAAGLHGSPGRRVVSGAAANCRRVGQTVPAWVITPWTLTEIDRVQRWCLAPAPGTGS